MVTNFKPMLLGAIGEHSKQRNVEAKPFLCREAIEERTFASHFWKLCTFVLGVISFDGFMRSGIT